MTTRKDEYVGTEFDWFLIDRFGALGACSTAGYGEIPAAVLRDLPEGREPIEFIDSIISTLPQSGSHSVQGEGPGACSEWRQLGNRGLFVFDWQSWSRSYVCVIRPVTPFKAGQLPSDLYGHLRPVIASGVDFDSLSEFRVSDLEL